MTVRILAFSRAAIDDAGTLSPFELNGSFQASLSDWAKAYQGEGDKTLIGWARMMDCFDEFLFIAEDSKETATGSLWKLEEALHKAGQWGPADKAKAPAIVSARYTENREGDVLALGYTQRIWVENASQGLHCLVKPDADLEGRFTAFDMENHAWLVINGWHFDIEG